MDIGRVQGIAKDRMTTLEANSYTFDNISGDGMTRTWTGTEKEATKTALSNIGYIVVGEVATRTLPGYEAECTFTGSDVTIVITLS